MAVATNVYSGKGFPGNYEVGAMGMPGEEVTVVRYFDCTSRTLAVGSHQVCVIPAGMLVSQVEIHPTVASTATATYAWGDSATANIFKAAAALAANVAQTSTGSQYYSAANEVQFTVATANDIAGKFFVVVRMIRVNATAV
jgi:hypothetical protein